MNRCVDFDEKNKTGKWCCTDTKKGDQFVNQWKQCDVTDDPKVEGLIAEVELDAGTHAFSLDKQEKSNLEKIDLQWEGPGIYKSYINSEYFSVCKEVDPKDEPKDEPKDDPKD